VDWLEATFFALNAGAPFGVSVADTDASDPVRTIAAGPARCDVIKGLPVDVRFPREGFVTPIRTNENGCPDGDVLFFARVSGAAHQLRQYNWNDGHPEAGQYLPLDLKGLGHGTRPGQRVGTTASGVAASFGLPREAEINPRGRRIEHALQMVLEKPGARLP
jgi:hypothetical protein